MLSIEQMWSGHASHPINQCLMPSATLAEGGIPKGFWSKQRCYTSHRSIYIMLAGSYVSNAAKY